MLNLSMMFLHSCSLAPVESSLYAVGLVPLCFFLRDQSSGFASSLVYVVASGTFPKVVRRQVSSEIGCERYANLAHVDKMSARSANSLALLGFFQLPDSAGGNISSARYLVLNTQALCQL